MSTRTIVIEVGSRLLRLGLGGEARPRVVWDTEREREALWREEDVDTDTDTDTDTNIDTNTNIEEGGQETNFHLQKRAAKGETGGGGRGLRADRLSSLLSFLLSEYLLISPRNCRALLIEPIDLSRREREAWAVAVLSHLQVIY